MFEVSLQVQCEPVRVLDCCVSDQGSGGGYLLRPVRHLSI